MKVGDFGLVRFADHDSDLTTGWLGTPDYMAPEQFVDATKVTPAADQYAIGIILFQILTETKPFPPLKDRTEFTEHLSLKQSPPPTPSRTDREVNQPSSRHLQTHTQSGARIQVRICHPSSRLAASVA